jgi:hypothetical protein
MELHLVTKIGYSTIISATLFPKAIATLLSISSIGLSAPALQFFLINISDWYFLCPFL